jgi:hypothetical protein
MDQKPLGQYPFWGNVDGGRTPVLEPKKPILSGPRDRNRCDHDPIRILWTGTSSNLQEPRIIEELDKAAMIWDSSLQEPGKL